MIIILIPVSLFLLINSIILFSKKRWESSAINFLLALVIALFYYIYSQSFSLRLREAEISNLRSENLELNIKILELQNGGK
jgi:hypothetical protein